MSTRPQSQQRTPQRNIRAARTRIIRQESVLDRWVESAASVGLSGPTEEWLRLHAPFRVLQSLAHTHEQLAAKAKAVQP